MDKEEYKKLTKKIIPKTLRIKKLLVSFFIGGLMGFLTELLVLFYSSFSLINKTNASSLMMMTFIILSSLFTALGFFDKFVSKFEAGLIVPITGFAHSTTSSAMEYKKEGLVYGIGANIFKMSGSVILYGVVSAYIFGIIRYVLLGG